jgi:putative endonuclease
MYWTYILECCDGSYYVGSTADLDARFHIHSSGNGPEFTAERLPVRLVHSEGHSSLEAATQRELQLKRWSNAKKAALIASDKIQLKTLSRCHGQLTE